MRIIIFLTVVACACGGPSYGYAPETSNAVASGLPAVRTPIPQERPQGSIEVASYGITRLDGQVPALHVRAIVTNDGDDLPWRLDTREQLVEIPGEGQSHALYANTPNVGTLPIIDIGRHVHQVVDFFFPLPSTVASDAQLPHFEVLWQVETPARTVASRTAFDRYATDVAYVQPYYEPTLWGPYWWFDPLYPRIGFVHRPFFVGHGGRIGVGHFGGHFHASGGHVAGGHHR